MRAGFVILGVVSSLAVPAPAAATFPGDDGSLAFEVHRGSGGPGHIAIAPVGGPSPSAATPLTPADVDSADPAWSPDGRRIAYTTNSDGSYDLHVVNADGTEDRRLTTGAADETDPSWSLDGERLAFTSDASGNSDVYVMAVAGGPARRLTFDRASDRQPDWAPIGDLIAFESVRNGTPDIFTMRPDGSEQTARIVGPGFQGDPSWRPDGEALAYTASDGAASEIRVAVVPITGANGAALFPDARGPGVFTGLSSTAARLRFPAWSPRGTGLAYTSDAVRGIEGHVASAAQARGIHTVVASGRNADWGRRPPPVLAPAAPEPEVGKTANARPDAGAAAVVTLPTSNAGIALTRPSELPEGTTFDTRAGAVTLETTDRQGDEDLTTVEGGVATFSQTGPAAAPLTDFTLARPRCGGTATAARAARRRGGRRSNALRIVHRTGSNVVRAKGKRARGGTPSTTWTMVEGCRRTIVRVHQHTVDVFDTVRRRTVVVRAGWEYCSSDGDFALRRITRASRSAKCTAGRRR